MLPEDRDESAIIDLAVVNNQGRQQQRQRQQQQQDLSSPLAISPNLFTSDNSLQVAGTSNTAANTSSSARKQTTSTAANNNNNNNNRRSKPPPEKKDCPRHADGHPPNKYTTRDLGHRRIVSLFFGSDILLFDSILTYKLGNPDKRVEDAIDAFEEHQGADAMANIIYETQAFDMIFKYTIPEHARSKIPDEPPVLGLTPGTLDIEISSTSSAAMARKEAKLEQQRQSEEEKKSRSQQEGQGVLLAALEQGGGVEKKDLEASYKDPKVEKEDKLKRCRHRFKKALLKEGLVLEEEPSIDGDEMFLKIYTPFWRLCIEAQRLRYKVELTRIEANKEKADADRAVAKAESQGFLNRYLRRFLQRADNVALPLRPESLLFKASKLRQYAQAERTRKWSDIVRHGGGVNFDGSGVGSQIGSDGKDGFFGTGRRGNLTESVIIYSKFRTKKGDRHALKSVMDKKAYSSMFTLHEGSYKSKVQPVPNRRTLLYHSWVQSRRYQPLEEIRFYYGEKIALYFAWIGHYTQWLISAAIVGLAFLIFGLINYFVPSQRGDLFDNALTLPFSLFMSIWATLFVEFWKRKSNVLAYEWNTLDFERRERARPEFKPTGTRVSPVTGKMELFYPRYRQILSVVTSIFVVLISIGIVIVSVGSLMFFSVWLRGDMPGTYKSTAITAVLNLVVIMALGTVYARLAKFLTDNENHRRLTQYQDALIIKRFLFDFVNFYSAMVYIGYFKSNLGQTLTVYKGQTFHDNCVGSCMNELTIQLAIVFVGKQFLNQAQELAIPQIQSWWNRKKELAEKASLIGKYKDKKPDMAKPPQWAKDDILPDCNPQMFEEYRELVIQFGFCTLFVVAFPIAPIFALLNNALEIRVDAFKMLSQHRRPIAQAAQDIGSWEHILTMLTHISVFTNACLIAFRSKWMLQRVFMMVPWFQTTVGTDLNYSLIAIQLLFIFIYEHVVLLFKVLIAHLVRDVPQKVKLAIERENYYTRLALDDEEPAMDEVLEDMDDDTDDSDDDEDFRKRFFNNANNTNMDDIYTNYEHDPSDEKDLASRAAETAEELQEEEEDEAELEALIKAGGCGCAAHGDGLVGTAKSGFDGTWMSRFRPETQAALRRRQQRRKKKQQPKEETA